MLFLFCLLLSLIILTEPFFLAPPANSRLFVPRRGLVSPPLLSTPDPNANSPPSPERDEKTLRNELASRAEILNENDQKAYSYNYSEDPVASSAKPPSPKRDKIAIDEKLLKDRPYPLFLLEKACDVLDEVGTSLSSIPTALETMSGSPVVPPPRIAPPNRENIVVLGTGWGAASFIKTISGTTYDVTVVSPRNFFLFTPMLAGAAVGTVEYRSITEVSGVCVFLSGITTLSLYYHKQTTL